MYRTHRGGSVPVVSPVKPESTPKQARVVKQRLGNAARGKLASPKRSCTKKNTGRMINFGSFAVKTQ